MGLKFWLRMVWTDIRSRGYDTFWNFDLSSSLAAEPAFLLGVRTSVHRTSHTNSRPLHHGISDIPAGRSPSESDMPLGSSTAGALTVAETGYCHWCLHGAKGGLHSAGNHWLERPCWPGTYVLAAGWLHSQGLKFLISTLMWQRAWYKACTTQFRLCTAPSSLDSKFH